MGTDSRAKLTPAITRPSDGILHDAVKHSAGGWPHLEGTGEISRSLPIPKYMRDYDMGEDVVFYMAVVSSLKPALFLSLTLHTKSVGSETGVTALEHRRSQGILAHKEEGSFAATRTIC